MDQETAKNLTFQAWAWCLIDAKFTNSAKVLAGLLMNRYNPVTLPNVDLPAIHRLSPAQKQYALAIIHLEEEPHSLLTQSEWFTEQDIFTLIDMYADEQTKARIGVACLRT